MMIYKIPIMRSFAIKLLAMAKNTSVTLGEHFDLFIQQALKQGRYKNASEVIRAGLRLLEHEEQKVRALQAALEEGEKSGIAKNFDPKKHLKRIKSERK